MNRFKCYMMSVLAYYRAEWTDVSDNDDEYRLLVTKELQTLVKACFRRKMNVPNAAKEVEIFVDLAASKSKTNGGRRPEGRGCSEGDVDADAKP